MSYANIGMRPDYMYNLPYQPKISSTQQYSPLQTVSGLQSQQAPQPSDAQQVIGALSMANTANNAVKGLTGFDPSKELTSYIKDALQNNPTVAQEVIGAPYEAGNWINDLSSSSSAPSVATDLNWVNNTPSELFGPDSSWIANAPGNEAADYLSSLGSEGLGQGIDLAGGAGSFANMIPGVGSYLSIGSDLFDGSGWGWDDTGRILGSYFGPVGTMIGGMIGKPVGDAIEGIGGALSDVVSNGGIVGDAVGGVGDALSGVGDALGSIGGGGCFLTTACMRKHGENFADDCRELTALRGVRDNYIRAIPGGSELVEEYYRKAPEQVAKLNARKDADKVFEKMYHEYITPAVEAAESGDNAKALNIYLNLVDWVNKETEEV